MLKISAKGLLSFKTEYKISILKKMIIKKKYYNQINKIKYDKLKNYIIDHIASIVYFEKTTDKIYTEYCKEYDLIFYELCDELYRVKGDVTQEKILEILGNEDLLNKQVFEIDVDDYKGLTKKEFRKQFLSNRFSEEYNLLENKKIVDEIEFFNIGSDAPLISLIKKLENIELREWIVNNLTKILICEDNSNLNYRDQLESIIEDVLKIQKEDPQFILFNDCDVLKRIFDYRKYIYRNGFRDKILNAIGINVCPYCGRQFISSYVKDVDEKNSADLDHFFVQEHYPYLALSLFNFVPSCHICNSRLKHEKNFYENKHLYPYVEGFEDDAVFDIDDSNFFLDIVEGKQKAKIVIKNKAGDEIKKEKINNSIKTFCIESIYQNHSKNVKDIFELIQLYNSKYIQDIVDLLYDEKDSENENIEKGSENKNVEKFLEIRDLVLKEKDPDEVLSKLHNDLVKKYWKNGQ